MKVILFAATIALAQFASAQLNYTSQVEFSTSTSQIQIDDAQYTLVPTKTVVREIPGCDPYADSSPTCSETIVLESQPAIQVNISYIDSFLNDGQSSYTSVLFPVSAFSAADVAALKAVYPSWKHPFTSIPRKFAKNKLALSVAKVKKDIQIVDMKRSTICHLDDNMNPAPGCVEKLVYKTVQSSILLATVAIK